MVKYCAKEGSTFWGEGANIILDNKIIEQVRNFEHKGYDREGGVSGKLNRNEGSVKLYRGADKSLAQSGRKQATATEDFDVHISYFEI